MPYGKGINWTTSQDPKTTETTLGSTNRALLASIFPTSPIYGGGGSLYDHAAVVKATSDFIGPAGVLIDKNPDFPAGVHLDFSANGAPDISEATANTPAGVTVAKKASDPTTPWSPNISSPGETPGKVNLDPDSPLRPIPANNPKAYVGDFVEGTDSTVNPFTTAKEMGTFVYGPSAPIALGKHPGEK